MKRSRIIVSTVGTVLIAGAIGATVALNQPSSTGADTSPLTAQLDSQSKELANHEARITNNENNINALAQNTNTTITAAPATTSSPVAASTPAADPATAASVTVTAFQPVPLDNGNTDCMYTYSDGTTYHWHWKVINPQGSWVTDGAGQNGHWVAATLVSGKCDQGTMGSAKAN